MSFLFSKTYFTLRFNAGPYNTQCKDVINYTKGNQAKNFEIHRITFINILPSIKKKLFCFHQYIRLINGSLRSQVSDQFFNKLIVYLVLENVYLLSLSLNCRNNIIPQVKPFNYEMIIIDRVINVVWPIY